MLRAALGYLEGVNRRRDTLVASSVGVMFESPQEVRPLLGGSSCESCSFDDEIAIAQRRIIPIAPSRPMFCIDGAFLE